MKKRLLPILMIFIQLCVYGQEVTGFHQIKWIPVGSLQSWFSNAGTEVEYGRRGRACCQNLDQTDQFYWDAQFAFQDRVCSKGLWIGCKNFEDPVSGETYSEKVISAGPRFADVTTLTMPVVFRMVGRFLAPTVLVDGEQASNTGYYDLLDEVDPDLFADRMVITVIHTPLGLTITRKIYGFSQQYHDNYFIFDYMIKNTGIIDLEGTTAPQTLEGVVFHLQERYALGFASFMGGWSVAGNVSWGVNTVHRVIGTDPVDPDFQYRAYFSWYHPHSQSPSFESDWGNPDHRAARALGAPAFIGGVTLHADTAPGDSTDDPSQPFGTGLIDSDHATSSNIDQTNRAMMTDKYNFMTSGHWEVDHADMIGDQFGDGSDDAVNGWDQTQNYGPYTLEPGDSVHIVQAEGVGGLNRALSQEIGTKWFNDDGPFDMPDGSSTDDRDAYKKAWVWTAEDSMMQLFERATYNYMSGFEISQPPPPPETFTVFSGANRIVLTWAENAVSTPHFGGYGIYRATGRVDTIYTLIFDCDVLNAVHQFVDRDVRPGFDYYYFIVTKGDGSQNNLYPGIPLISSKYWTLTNRPARLQTTDVASDPKFPEFYSLEQNFPNPFNPETRIRFSLPAPQSVNLVLYDRLGRQVKILVQDAPYAAGVHTVTLRGEDLESGLYLCRIRAGIWSAFRKLIVVK